MLQRDLTSLRIFVDVGVFLGGGGGDGKVSVVVYKLLHQYSSVGDHIFHVVNAAIQLLHDCGFCGGRVGYGANVVGAAEFVAAFYGGTLFAFQSGVIFKEGCLPVGPCFGGSV